MTNDEQLEALKKAAYELAGAYWRLNKYGMVNDLAVIESEDKHSFDLWCDIAKKAVNEIQKILLNPDNCNTIKN